MFMIPGYVKGMSKFVSVVGQWKPYAASEVAKRYVRTIKNDALSFEIKLRELAILPGYKAQVRRELLEKEWTFQWDWDILKHAYSEAGMRRRSCNLR
jgi:hypothetical protein